MKNPLTNGGAFLIAIISLYSTGHWIGASALLVFSLYTMTVEW